MNQSLRRSIVALSIFIAVVTWKLIAPEGHHTLDVNVTQWVVAHRNETLNLFFRAMTWLCNPEVIIPIIGLCALIWFIRYRNGRIGGYLIVTAFVGNIIVNTGLKYWIQRPRPEAIYHLVHASGYSFPSGHSFASGLIYPLIGYLAIRYTPWRRYQNMIGIFILIIMLCVPFSRVYLGVHYLSDIVAGFALGQALFWISVAIDQRYHVGCPSKKHTR